MYSSNKNQSEMCKSKCAFKEFIFSFDMDPNFVLHCAYVWKKAEQMPKNKFEID